MTVIAGKIPLQEGITINTTVTDVLAEAGNNPRLELVLTNTGSFPVALGVGQDAAVDVGIVLQPTASIYWGPDNMTIPPQHKITAIADGTASSMGIYMRSA